MNVLQEAHLSLFNEHTVLSCDIDIYWLIMYTCIITLLHPILYIHVKYENPGRIPFEPTVIIIIKALLYMIITHFYVRNRHIYLEIFYVFMLTTYF